MESSSAFLIGRVFDRDPVTATVRVVFPSLKDLASDWLPVLFAKTLEDQLVWLPDIGEHVACLVDRFADSGCVLGALYSKGTAPPITNGDKAHITFKDGTTIDYDRVAHKLAITLVAAAAEVDLATTGAVNVTTSGGDVTINVADGQKVILGGAGALDLATKTFVTAVYEAHVHPTPVGLSGPPILTGTEAVWPNVTEKAVGR